MKIRMRIVVLFLISAQLLCASAWKIPRDNRRYDQTTFLVAHNAPMSKAYGWGYAQQKLTITEQLKNGVRGLMIDTHDKKFGHKGLQFDAVYSCHANCSGAKAFLMSSPKIEKRKMQFYAQEIADYLKKNKKAIVTIFLENYVDDNEKLKEAFLPIQHYLLIESDWDPVKKHGWPTLGWMRRENKRIVIFCDRHRPKNMWWQWNYVAESTYGELDKKKVSNERIPDSIMRRCCGYNRYLSLINYFPTLGVGNDWDKINGPKLREVVNYVMKNGFCAHVKDATKTSKRFFDKDRYPNFIAVDNIHIGNTVKFASSFNEKTTWESERKVKYKQLEQSRKIVRFEKGKLRVW